MSLGGDADTQGAIAGSIAWAYYDVNPTDYDKANNGWILAEAQKFIPADFQKLASDLQRISAQHFYDRKK